MSEIRVDLITEKTADGGVTIKSTGTGDNKPTLLTLQTSEADIAANDVLGKIQFQAPDEGTGTDAILVSAAIQARSEGDFAADANATAIDFMVGASEAAATKMSLSSTGVLTAVELDISGNIDVDGTTNLDVVDIDGALTQDGGAVFNEAGANADFRIESDDRTHMFHIDAANNNARFDSTNTDVSQEVYGLTPLVQIRGNHPNNASLLISEHVADANGASLFFYKSRNTAPGSFTSVAANDALGVIHFIADDGSDAGSKAALIACEIDGTPGTNDTPGRLTFYTTADGAADSTERMRIHSNGVASFNNGIALGVGTANTASNVLDDYEEGTFTAAFTVASGSVAVNGNHDTLSYIKIGNVVHTFGQLVSGSVSSPSGAISVNLPFAVSNLTESAGDAWQPIFAFLNGSGITNGNYMVIAEVEEGTSLARLYYKPDHHVANNLSEAVGSGSDIWLRLTYRTG